MRTHFSDWILGADYEFSIFYYDVIMTLHAAVMTSFFYCFAYISKTTYVRNVEVAPNDAEYMISYLSSIQYLVVSPSEKELIQKNLFLSVFLLTCREC